KNMNVIDPAVTPRIPIGPNRLRIILIGLLLSLCMGVVIALAIEFLDNTVKTTDDVGRLLNLPTLAVIPAMEAKKSRLLLSNRKGAQQAVAVKAETASIFSQTTLSEMLTGQGYSAFAETYRGLRTSVLLSTAGNPPKTILFTSSQPGEGKTTTTVNTGVS